MMRISCVGVAVLWMAQSFEVPSITAHVFGPDGKPVATGSVALMTETRARVTAAIARDGGFRIEPDSTGRQSLFISVPGLALYRAYVNVPPSRRMALPDIQLLPATYYRVRPVSPEGEPMGRGVRWSSLDADGNPVLDLLQHTQDQVDPDGTITVGPLPIGRTMLAFDRAPFAPARLRDATVNGSQRVIDAGNITIRPPARLQVAIVDAAGKPVKQHDVWIEDAVLPSPLMGMTMKTDDEGQALFERLAAGRYRVWTRTIERCNNQLLITRLVTTTSGGLAHTRIAIGGQALLQVRTPTGPLPGRNVSLRPEMPAQPPPPQRSRSAGPTPMPRPIFSIAPACHGITDSSGAVAFAPMPPGPAELTVRLFNSTYFKRISVPETGVPIPIDIPDGLMPVHVTDAATHRPMVANLVWLGGGARVEAITTANGDALLEGVGYSGGTLTISARDHQTLEGSFTETPDTVQEVALTPLRPERIVITITTDAGAPLPNAVVELQSERVGDAAEISVTDERGIAPFPQLPPGMLRMRVHAEGFVDAAARVGGEGGGSIGLALKRAP